MQNTIEALRKYASSLWGIYIFASMSNWTKGIKAKGLKAMQYIAFGMDGILNVLWHKWWGGGGDYSKCCYVI